MSANGLALFASDLRAYDIVPNGKLWTAYEAAMVSSTGSRTDEVVRIQDKFV